MFRYEPVVMVMAVISLMTCVVLIIIAMVFPEAYEAVGEFVREIAMAFRA